MKHDIRKRRISNNQHLCRKSKTTPRQESQLLLGSHLHLLSKCRYTSINALVDSRSPSIHPQWIQVIDIFQQLYDYMAIRLREKKIMNKEMHIADRNSWSVPAPPKIAYQTSTTVLKVRSSLCTKNFLKGGFTLPSLQFNVHFHSICVQAHHNGDLLCRKHGILPLYYKRFGIIIPSSR